MIDKPYLLNGTPVSAKELIAFARVECRHEDEMQEMERELCFFTSSCAALLRRQRNGGHDVREALGDE